MNLSGRVAIVTAAAGAGIGQETARTLAKNGAHLKTPVKRDGKPEDIAQAILFLVGDEASFITGETLCVSGGLYMR